MDLILWRHAEAEPGEPDLGRRLTAKGIQQAGARGEVARSASAGTTRILESRPIARSRRRIALKRKFRTVSFDHHFGRYCTGTVDAADCDMGRRCCEAMPPTTPGAEVCHPVDPTAENEHLPNDSVACMK